jgi:hypothetical protein
MDATDTSGSQLVACSLSHLFFFVNSHESRRKLALCATLSKPLDDLSLQPLTSPCPSYSGMTSMALIEG